MAVTFTSTMAGASADYLKYTWREGSQIQKQEQKNSSTLLDFALVPWDSSFVKLTRGAYIKINSTTYPNWYTGYVTNNPDLEYLGRGSSGPVWGYRYHATADEVILSLNPIGLIPTFYNVHMGDIIKTLASRLTPGLFDVTNVQQGPLVAQYYVDPTKTFLQVTQELCEAASYVFYGRDHKLYFLPQDSLTATTLDGNNKHFTPKSLHVTAVTTPIVNDVSVVGMIEPQRYVQEYFLGTGMTSDFPLIDSVYGADSSMFIDENFSGTSIDTSKWIVSDPTSTKLKPQYGYLNCLGGTGNASYDVYTLSAFPLPMEGNMRFTHGEFDFLGGGGLVGSVWTNGIHSDFSGCLYGIVVNGTTLNPIVNGSGDGTQTVTVSTSKRYCIRTVAQFTKAHRTLQPYSYIDKNGVVQTVNGTTSGPDQVTWQTYITEIDPTTGLVTNSWDWSNTATLTGTNDTYASYAPVVSNNLQCTVTGITISTPVNVSLATSSSAPFNDLGFDFWADSTHLGAWSGESVDGIHQSTGVISGGRGQVTRPMAYVQGSALQLKKETDPLPYVAQYANGAIKAGLTYNILCQARRTTGMITGSLKLVISGTGVAETGITIPVTSIPTTKFQAFYGQLTGPISSVPSDLALKVYLSGSTSTGESVYVDEVSVTTAWKLQLVGPNEIDAIDGKAPIATIVQSNSGSTTVSSYTGSPQYNPGQGQLVFYSDSVNQTSNVPPEGSLVRLMYRSAGAAIGRVKDTTSITSEASAWGDSGIRSSVIMGANPRPRTSQECELAAKSYVNENSYQHYQGTYEQRSEYLSNEPRASSLIKFTNLSNMATFNAEEINQVTTVLDSSNPESFIHNIYFGKPDVMQQFLNRAQNPLGSFQPTADAAYPSAVDVSSVGTQYGPDASAVNLLSWDDSYIYIDGGQNLAGSDFFEVRYTDTAWGSDDSRNLVGRFTSRQFSVPRSLRGSVFYVRLNTSGLYSRYSSAVHIAFPLPTVTYDVPPTIQRVNSNTTLVAPTTGNLLVEMDTSVGAITVTLPPSSSYVGRNISCVMSSYGADNGVGYYNATVNASSGDTYSGATTWTFSKQWQGVEFTGVA